MSSAWEAPFYLKSFVILLMGVHHVPALRPADDGDNIVQQQPESNRESDCKFRVVDHVSTFGAHGVSFYNLILHQLLRDEFHVCYHSCGTWGGPTEKLFKEIDTSCTHETSDSLVKKDGFCLDQLKDVAATPEGIHVVVVSTVKRVRTVLEVQRWRKELGNPPIVWAFHFNWEKDVIRSQQGIRNVFLVEDILQAYSDLTSNDKIVYASHSAKMFWESKWWATHTTQAQSHVIPPSVSNTVGVVTEHMTTRQVDGMGITLWKNWEKLRITRSETLIVQAGQINSMKNQLLSLVAFKTWHKDLASNINAHFLIIGARNPPPGQTQDKAYLDEVIQEIKKINIEEENFNHGLRVSLVEMQPQHIAWQLISLADVFCFPTRNEVFGMMPLEAMATRGSPIVVTSRDDGFPCSERGYVKDGMTGICFDRTGEDDADANRLAFALQRAITEKSTIQKNIPHVLEDYGTRSLIRDWARILNVTFK